MRKLVIIPTYNEKENIESIIRAVLSLKESFDLLVVDDSSPDGTSEIVDKIRVAFNGRLFLETREKKDGLGKAYLHGFEWAIKRKYDYIFEMDADFSHDPLDLINLYKACENGADVAVGSRYKTGVNVVNWPMSRVLLSYCASKYVQLITRMPIYDPTSGFMCYKRKALEGIDLSSVKLKGYGFQVEMKYKIWKKGYRISEVPIIFTDRVLGESKISSNIIFEAIFGVIDLRLKSLFKRL